jgi:CheY-like chemotaxis protein
MLQAQGFECVEAGDGEETIARWREHRPSLMLLDLNMPKKTGYQVLETMKAEGNDTVVIVVSGDIQPKARERVVALGARAMVYKPLDQEQIETIISLIKERMAEVEHPAAPVAAEPAVLDIGQDELDALSEIVNVGMGQAAASLAKMLETFLEISVPVPQSLEQFLESQQRAGTVDSTLVVQQAFTGDLRGEVLAVFDEKQMHELRDLLEELGHRGSTDHELVLEMSNTLIGAAITSIAKQLAGTVRFSRPSILGRGPSVLRDLCRSPEAATHLVISIGISIEGRVFSVTLLIVLPLKARERLHQALEAFLKATFGS